jgi:selenocysteine lyase/cysteine desulfurase
VPNIYAGVAGMSIIEEAGTAAIEEHIAGLAARLIDGLEEMGAVVPTPRDPARRGPLVTVRSTDVPRLVDELAAEQIVCSERDSNLRIALHLYNVEEDVDRLLDALRKKRPLLA